MWNDKFPMPDLTNPLFVVRGTVVDSGGDIVGAGFIRLTAEAIIFMEPTLKRGMKSRIMHLLFNAGIKACLRKGLDNLHAFVYDKSSFTNFLVKRLGFKRVDADVLSIRIGD